jgi:hypothetical protein
MVDAVLARAGLRHDDREGFASVAVDGGALGEETLYDELLLGFMPSRSVWRRIDDGR